MSKEEGGRLLSKMAKFVRNPLKDWSELDAPDRNSQPSPVDSSGYTREALKELIERRQRNDFVRKREFDMLRKLRQREAASARSAGGVASSSFHLNTVGKTDGRALTLKKIDEIEEQMSQQWWKAGGRHSKPGGIAEDGASAQAPSSPQQARAYADTAPGEAPPVMANAPGAHPVAGVAAGASTPTMAAAVQQWVCDTDMKEAALRFAEGHDDLAERLMLGAVSQEGAHADDDDAWLTLLDFYRAKGDAEKFAATSMRYAQRFRRPGPEWVSLRALAHSEEADASSRVLIDWYSPEKLNRESLLELTQVLARAGAVWSLDWRALRSIAPDAVGPLGALLSHWADLPTQVRFSGADRLIAALSDATPLAVKETDQAWWKCYLALLRLMHMPDDFELVALNYCITYEALPPNWQDPVGHYEGVTGSANSRPGALQFEEGGDGEPSEGLLSGELRGDSAHDWQRLEADLADARASAVGCAALVRMDPAATLGLLNWVKAREARGLRVELVDVHRLLVVLFELAGVHQHATISPRR